MKETSQGQCFGKHYRPDTAECQECALSMQCKGKMDAKGLLFVSREKDYNPQKTGALCTDPAR